MNDCPNVFATQRYGESPSYKTIDDLHALKVAGSLHDVEQRTVKRQRALQHCESSEVSLAQQLRLFTARRKWSG